MLKRFAAFALGALVLSCAPATDADPKNGAAVPEPASPSAPAAEPSVSAAPAGEPAPGASPAAALALVPRSVLFGNPERSRARLSPDAATLSWVAPDEGVLNVWVAPTSDLAAARVLTKDRGRGVRAYFWAPNGTHILYQQDRGGDENWRVYSVDVATGAEIDLTPFEGARADIYAMSWDKPDEAMIGVNDRDPQYFDVYRVNVKDGAREKIYENKDEIGSFEFDHANALRVGTVSKPDGSISVKRRTGDAWEDLANIPFEDSLTTNIIGFAGDNASLYVIDTRSRDKAALVKVGLADAATEVLGQSDKADVQGVMIHPTEHRAEAYAVNYLRTEWTAIDPKVAGDLERLQKDLAGDVEVVDRSKDDRTWLVFAGSDRDQGVYHLYKRDGGTLTKLFAIRPELERFTLAPMHPVEIKSRDGLTLVSYLTLPPNADANADGRPDAPLPLVLNVHGGPWSRDAWGFDPEHQWLANRGYGVLSVNFRASTGFGKAFLNAGNLQWGEAMHNDLLDAVDWAVKEGVTTRDKVAIYGGSYGGYAVLAGLTFTPETFACGVDIVGPSNLNTLLESIPPYWKSFFEQLAKAVGDPRTAEGQALLKERSPLSKAADIKRPLLIAQGANDPRVKKAESDQIVEAMKANGLPVTYALFPDEGHGFARPENRLAFYAVSEGFLAKCLGGRAEPIGEAFTGSSLTILEGAEHVEGLPEALKAHTPVVKGG